jgi:hypothetical protein
MTVSVLIVVFYVVTLFSIVGGYQCLGGTHHLHLQGWNEYGRDTFRLYRQACKQHGLLRPWGQKSRWDLVSLNWNDIEDLKRPILISDLKQCLVTVHQNGPQNGPLRLFSIALWWHNYFALCKSLFLSSHSCCSCSPSLLLPTPLSWGSTFPACLYNLTAPCQSHFSLKAWGSLILWRNCCTPAVLNVWQIRRLKIVLFVHMCVHKSDICDPWTVRVSIPCVLGNWGWSVHFSAVSKAVCMLSLLQKTPCCCVSCTISGRSGTVLFQVSRALLHTCTSLDLFRMNRETFVSPDSDIDFSTLDYENYWIIAFGSWWFAPQAQIISLTYLFIHLPPSSYDENLHDSGISDLLNKICCENCFLIQRKI